MERIASFCIDHLKLERGIYVSRKDYVGKEVLTSFDIRMKLPYREPVLGSPEIHTIEHLAATWLRNNPEWKDKIIYWGPMGCMTGNYLILAGDYTSKDIAPLITELFEYIANFEGALPGGTEKECGNCYSHDLKCARTIAHKFFNDILINPGIRNLNYQK